MNLRESARNKHLNDQSTLLARCGPIDRGWDQSWTDVGGLEGKLPFSTIAHLKARPEVYRATLRQSEVHAESASWLTLCTVNPLWFENTAGSVEIYLDLS